MDKYRPCPYIIAMLTSDSQHPPRSKHAVYLGVDEMVGAWCFGCLSGPPGFTYGFICSGIQFYLLLSPYPCFILFLYLHLYVLGNEALISYWSFTQIKYLCLDPHLN